MKEELVAGVIGAGNISSYHVCGYMKAGVKIAAIVDINVKLAKSLAEKYGIEKIFEHYEDMLNECPEINLLSICLPNFLHAETTIRCLNAGRNVLCEKPPALNADQTMKMKEAAERAGKVLMFGFNNRARADVQALMKHIKRDELGKINSAQAIWTRRRAIPGFGSWFMKKKLSGGGAVIDLIHVLDLTLYFMGYPHPEWVLAKTFNNFASDPAFQAPWSAPNWEGGSVDVETAAHALITFKTGQVLYLRNSWADMVKFAEDISVDLQGTKAGLKVSMQIETYGGKTESSEMDALNKCEIYTMENGHPVDKTVKVDLDPDMGRERSLMNFVNVVAGKEKSLNDPAEAVILMKIIDALYKSAETNAPIKIK
jgi:predicted dehydrogenase